MTDFVLQPITTNELSEFFKIPIEILQIILSHLKLEDLNVLHFVCVFFKEMTLPSLTCTTLYITEASEPEPEFIKFRETNRKFMYPFLYQEVVLVNPTQSPKLYGTTSPILAMFTTNGKLPKGIDASQVRCIAHSTTNIAHPPKARVVLGYGIFRIDHDECLDYYECLDFLTYCKLPNLKVLIIHDTSIYAKGLDRCKTNPGLQCLDIAGCKVVEDRLYRGDDSYYPLTLLQNLVTTISHHKNLNLPEFYNLKSCVIHLPKMNDPIPRTTNPKGRLRYMKHFEADRYKLLNHWEILCDSPTRICHFKFGLPNTNCLHEFKCNATPAQATFTVYGIRNDRGKFIKQAPHNWFSKLNKIMVRKDFQWWIEVAENVCLPYCFKEVILKQGVEPEYYLETGDEPKNAEK